jgi:thiosulfate/3-mercaptopyruvate sulfurtransferase
MLVSSKWLAARLDDRSLVVADMRWREDGSGREVYESGHIPGAVYLDWSRDLVEPTSAIAFMLAGPDRFAGVMEDRGIGDETVVVAYSDRMGSGPFRLWWASRVYGHDTVGVLDGGWDKWVAEGRAVSTDPLSVTRPARWIPRPSEGLVATAEEVASAAGGKGAVVLDSRPPAQYRGDFVWFETGQVAAGPDGVARTPRGEFRAGHVPGAVNVPYASLYRRDLTMKGPEELRELLVDAGVTPATRAITYCGCGISASALLFAMRLAGVEDTALYDASWEEWGRDPTRPVARG